MKLTVNMCAQRVALLLHCCFSACAIAQSTSACGDVIREAAFQNGGNGNAYAVDVYDCFLTVPFDPAVATRLVAYWNQTLQFQSTLEYLKHPPPGFQQPPVDLIAGLNEVQTTIDHGGFANEYYFEAALQNVLHSAHDSHVSFIGGVLSAFSFGSLNGLTSISIDGVQLPKVYFTSDLLLNQSNPSTTWQPSAIAQINGTDVFGYLTQFAALNSYGTLEPHADWNMLFDSPVLDVLDGFYPLWGGGATFYPGDNFNYTMENGTVIYDEFLAIYYDPGFTGPLETGGDFYNFFVLGFYPAACDGIDPDPSCPPLNSTNTTPAVSPLEIPRAYPNPDVSQQNLTVSGYTTGYYLKDQSLAVLSLPTFWADGPAIQDFADTVKSFIQGAQAAGLTKVVIDLQQNVGGDSLMAYTIFRQFFPSIVPLGGSERRSFPLADDIGSLITRYWDSLQSSDPDRYVRVSSNEWIATILLTEGGVNFTSWAELSNSSDPIFDGVDNFSAIERLNISNYAFDFSSFGGEQPPDVLVAPFSGNAPFAAENVIMLSDGLCASACSLFMEMMHHDAGVRNVVVGGRPSNGPMQTPSGSRGARFYDLSTLDDDISNAITIQEQSYPEYPLSFPNRSNQDVFSYGGGISLRAEVRPGNTVPLAMLYEAADCRIFYTPNTFNNFTNLWSYAADAIWTNPSLCVQGSTGYATTGISDPAPPAATPLADVNYTTAGMPALNLSAATIPFLYSDGPVPDFPPDIAPKKVRDSTYRNRLQPTTQVQGVAQQQQAQRPAELTRQSLRMSQPRSSKFSSPVTVKRRSLGKRAYMFQA